MDLHILNERYRIEEELGRGGMGVVYKAKDIQLDRYVAIKVLPTEFGHDEQFLERFKREVLNSAKLDHPNIVHVHDVGADAGVHYYVMQLIEGTDLHHEIQNSGGHMSIDECIRILNQVAQAVDYAHQNGIVHRDIKPENILLDSQRNVHVVDFGIAKSVEGTRLTGGMIGTPAYMSPEQGRGEDVDGRSDQYSLAIVAYEMLTGSPPFCSDTTQPWALVNMHISAIPPDPRELQPDLPDNVCTALIRALSKIPSERFSLCVEFVSAMKSIYNADSYMSNAKLKSTSIDKTQVVPKLEVEGISYSLVSKLRIVVALVIIALLVGGGLLIWGLTDRSDRKSTVETISRSPSSTTPHLSDGAINNKSSEVRTGSSVSSTNPNANITENEVNDLLRVWLLAQNNRDVIAYSACYSPKFKGIKRNPNGKASLYNYSGWLSDRKKMLTKTQDLNIVIENVIIVIDRDSTSAEAEFTQYFRTAKYGDKGPKLMRFRKINGKIKITYEEMKWSTKL